jgi:hypothetical protein
VVPAPVDRTTTAPPAASPPPTAITKRAQSPLLVVTWSRTALAPQLPLVVPVDPALPPSPKRRYRSAYRPPDPTALPDPTLWATWSDFEVALALIDFAPLERVLAAHYTPSQKGPVPFHPVSLFLCVCLRRELQHGWFTLARLLAHAEHGAGWRRQFGFTGGVTPSASGLRHFFHSVGADVFDQLCPSFITLLRQQGLCPDRSTYADDPPDRGVTVCQDGMLHPARQQHGCRRATDTCFRALADRPVATTAAAPTPAAAPAPDAPPTAATPPPGRPCRAQEHQFPGCACTAAPCQMQCRRASTLDPEARFIHYAGRTRTGAPATGEPTTPAPTGHQSTPGKGHGKGTGIDVFGYRSVCERVLADRFAVAWILCSGLYAANTDERTIFTARVQALRTLFPDLPIGEWLDDSGVGYGECLDAIWELGALRMVELRADPSDRNPAACLARGYDGVGRPLCPHGYRLRANGIDSQRRRTKYVCAQACRREPLQEDTPVQEVVGCPYLDSQTQGFVVNVGPTRPDGSVRLAREIPYGSDTWKARYGRRNLAESRNGQLESLGLKRMHSHGLPHNTKEVQTADFLLNLHTLGRLVRQASTVPPG